MAKEAGNGHEHESSKTSQSSFGCDYEFGKLYFYVNAMHSTSVCNRNTFEGYHL